MTDRPLTPTTLEGAIQQARDIAAFAKSKGLPCAMEVVHSRGKYIVQPFGVHARFKSHNLVHIEPIPA